jgi:hypothetical protein
MSSAIRSSTPWGSNPQLWGALWPPRRGPASLPLPAGPVPGLPVLRRPAAGPRALRIEGGTSKDIKGVRQALLLDCAPGKIVALLIVAVRVP